MTEDAVSQTIKEIIDRDREQDSHAADRRASGAGGVCEECGGPIGPERLEVLPSATRCKDCQAAWEQANRI